MSHRLSEQTHGGDLLLAVVNNAPIVLPGHGIQVALAQKTLIVRLHQLINRIGIAAVLIEIDLDSPGILLPAVHRLYFLIAADRFCHLGRGDGQRHREQQHHKQNAEQKKSVFLSGTAWSRIWLESHWRSGSVCVLWYGISSTWTDAELILTTR